MSERKIYPTQVWLYNGDEDVTDQYGPRINDDGSVTVPGGWGQPITSWSIDRSTIPPLRHDLPAAWVADGSDLRLGPIVHRD